MITLLSITIGGFAILIGLLLFAIAIAVSIANPVAGIICAFIFWEAWSYVSKQEKAKKTKTISPLVDRRGSSMDD